MKPLPASQPWHDRTPSRRRRFYRKDDPDDMEVRGRRSGMRYRAQRDSEGLREGEDESSDDESDSDDSDTEDVEQRRQAQKRTSTWDPSKFVEFAAFAEWHREECRVEGKPEPDTCWTQIKSFIKGSTEAFISGEPIPERDYLDDAKRGGRRTLNMDRNARRNAYKVFRSYELFLSEGEKWDACDREVALVQRVLRDGFKPRSDNARPAPFDKAYVDEVQDMTQASLAVLLLAVGGDPKRLYCCGDTAQAIQDGVAFRFSDLRQAIYDLQLKVHTLSRQKGFNGARALQHDVSAVPEGDAASAEKLRKLTKNYRAHAGVLGAANAVLELLYNAFPTAVDKTEPDAGVALGPRPIFAPYKEYLRDVDSKAVLLFRADALEAAQRQLGEESVDFKLKQEEVRRVAGEQASAAGGVAKAAQDYYQRRRDLAEVAQAHADEEMASRRAQKKEYDGAKKEAEKRRKDLAKRRKEWKDEEKKLRVDARDAAKKRGTKEARMVTMATKRRDQELTAAQARAAREHQAAQTAAGDEAFRRYGEQANENYQRALAAHALVVERAQAATAAPQGPPTARSLVGMFVGDRGSADAISVLMEAEDVDMSALCIMAPEDFADLGIAPALARQLQAAAINPPRAAAAAPPPPPPERSAFLVRADAVAAKRRGKSSVKPPAAVTVRPLAAYVDEERAKPQPELEVDEARAALPPTPTEEEAIEHVPDGAADVILPAAPRPHSKQDREKAVETYLDDETKYILKDAKVTIGDINAYKRRERERKKKAKKGVATDDDLDEAQKSFLSKGLKKLREETKANRKDKLQDVSGAFKCANLIENEEYGSRAFSVQEFKGLERDSVVLVDFFGSARDEKKKGWRDLLKAARGDGLKGIDAVVGENRALERDLKILYVALTRCRSKLVVLECDKDAGAAKDASKFFLQAAEKGRSALAEKAASRTSVDESDEDETVAAPVSGDEWRSRGALLGRVAAENADNPLAPQERVLAGLDRAKKCFENAQDSDLRARCDVSSACVADLRIIRSWLELAAGSTGDQRARYTRDAEDKAAATVKRAVEALAIDDALRVLGCFPGDDGVLADVVAKVEAVRDKALQETKQQGEV